MMKPMLDEDLVILGTLAKVLFHHQPEHLQILEQQRPGQNDLGKAGGKA